MQPKPITPVSIFLSAINDSVWEDKPANVDKIIEAIKTNAKTQEKTQNLRLINDPIEAKAFADTNFLCITWSGMFSLVRSPQTFQQPSGLIALHLADLTSERLDQLWIALQKDEFIYALFVDEWGSGLVIVTRIDCQQADHYLAFMNQVIDYYRDLYRVISPTHAPEGVKTEVDPESLDICWPCRIPYHEEAYHNPECSIMPLLDDYWPKAIVDQKAPPSIFDDLRAEQVEAQSNQGEYIEQEEVTGNSPNDTVYEPKSVGIFTIMSGNDWIRQAKSKPIPKMLCDELWLEGEICILFAEANQGKSIWAVQVGDSISRGEPIKGFRMEASAQPVLYFDFELSEKQFEARYSKEFQDHYRWHDNFRRVEIDPNAEIPVGYSFEDYLIESMEKTIQQTKAKVLIIDNITYLRNDTESAKEASPLMKHLKALKQRYALSLLILAHCPKRDSSRPLTRNDLQGSSRLNQFADSMMAIGASAKDSQLKYIKQVKVRSTAYKYDSENVLVCQIHQPGSFVLLDFLRFSTESEHLKQPTEKDKENQKELIQQLRAQGKNQTQIAKELGISQSTVSRTFAKPDKVKG